MNRLGPMLFILALVVGLIFAQPVLARNDLLTLPVHEAIQRGIEEGTLNNSIRLYFAGQRHPGIVKKLGEFRTNKKTNAFNKSDEEACEWALFSALKSLQERAQREGGNAVINIKSNYKSQEFSSPAEFQCGAGNILAGVALKGTVAKVK